MCRLVYALAHVVAHVEGTYLELRVIYKPVLY